MVRNILENNEQPRVNDVEMVRANMFYALAKIRRRRW
jgi:hypothetical protein